MCCLDFKQKYVDVPPSAVLRSKRTCGTLFRCVSLVAFFFEFTIFMLAHERRCRFSAYNYTSCFSFAGKKGRGDDYEVEVDDNDKSCLQSHGVLKVFFFSFL